MSSRCLEQKWHPHRLLRWPLRRQTAKKERRKKVYSADMELIYRFIHSGNQEWKVGQNGNGFSVPDRLLGYKKSPEIGCQQLTPIFHSQSITLHDRKSPLLYTNRLHAHTCNSSHMATNFLQTYFCAHNRREFFLKKIEFRQESQTSFLRGVWKFIDPLFKRISREYLDIKAWCAAFEFLFISLSISLFFVSTVEKTFNISTGILEWNWKLRINCNFFHIELKKI